MSVKILAGSFLQALLGICLTGTLFLYAFVHLVEALPTSAVSLVALPLSENWAMREAEETSES